MKLSKQELFSIAKLFLIWRFVLFFIAALASNFLTYQPSFPYSEELINSHWLPSWISSFANFDGVHYLTIAQKGYMGTGLIQAFFPLFPLLIKFFGFIFNDHLITGLILSNLFSFLLLVLYYLTNKYYLKIKKPLLATSIFLFFPSSFFLGSIYNESLFISLILLVFIFSKEKKWFLAGLVGSLAAATRIVGVFSILIILLEAKKGKIKTLFKFNKANLKIFLASLIASLGLIIYMLYLQITFNDPLYFLNVQAEFGAGRQTNLILYPQVVWRYLKILLTARPINWKYYSYVQDFLAGLGGFSFLAWQLWQKSKRKLKDIPLSLIVFSLFAFFTPTLTGTFSSMPRYILVCLSLFIGFNLILNQRTIWKIIYFSVSISMLIINTILFVQGYWVG